MSARPFMLLASLLLSAFAPLATAADSGASALDGTYAIDQMNQGRAYSYKMVFAGGHQTSPEKALCTLVPAADGFDVSWSVVTAPQVGSSGFSTEITDFLMSKFRSGGAHTSTAMASSAGGSSLPTTTTYHAHLSADGMLSGTGSSVSGSFPMANWTFTGRRIGPPSAARESLIWWYQISGDAGMLVWATDAVEIQLAGANGSGPGSGTFTVDGEGSTSGQCGGVCASYADGVATLTCGQATITFTDHGRTMTIGSHRFDLTRGRPTVRVGADGGATLVRTAPGPRPGPLDGRSFALTLHAGAKTASDTLYLEGGRCRLDNCSILGPPPTYTVTHKGEPSTFAVDTQSAPLGDAVTFKLSAKIDHGSITGSASITNQAGQSFTFDFTGTERGK